MFGEIISSVHEGCAVHWQDEIIIKQQHFFLNIKEKSQFQIFILFYFFNFWNFGITSQHAGKGLAG